MQQDRQVNSVALLFTDVEGSTRLIQKLGEARYGVGLGQHRRLLRAAVAEHGGREVDCRADELFAVFPQVSDALAAAVAAQRALTAWPWAPGAAFRVRIGIHAGRPIVAEGAYLGLDVNLAARICSAGHGGQVLVSDAARAAIGDGFEFRDLGRYTLAGLPTPQQIFQAVVPGLRVAFPSLRVTPAKTPGRGWRMWRRHVREPTLADLAWQTRTLLPHVSDDLRTVLGQLGASLFTGQRAAERADTFLHRVDHAQLAARLAAQQEMAVTYQRAKHEAELIQRQVAAVDDVRECRRRLADARSVLAPMLASPTTVDTDKVDTITIGIADATTRLDDAVTRASATLNRLCYKLDRTRYRGVYQAGGRYIVPYIDELGADCERDFQTLTQAHDFRTALQIAHKAQTDYTGPSYQGGAEAGGTGSI